MLTFLLLVAGAAVAVAGARSVVVTSRIVITSDPSAREEDPTAARLAVTGAVLLIAGVTCLLTGSGLSNLADLVSRIGVLALAGAAVSGASSAWVCRAGKRPSAADGLGTERVRERRRPLRRFVVGIRDNSRGRGHAPVLPRQVRRDVRPPAP